MKKQKVETEKLETKEEKLEQGAGSLRNSGKVSTELPLDLNTTVENIAPVDSIAQSVSSQVTTLAAPKDSEPKKLLHPIRIYSEPQLFPKAQLHGGLIPEQ